MNKLGLFLFVTLFNFIPIYAVEEVTNETVEEVESNLETSKMKQAIEPNNTFDQTTLSIILAASTTVLAIVAIIGLIYNRKIVGEMIIEREFSLRPFLVCKVISKPAKHVSVLYFVIHNQGKGPAKNIIVNLTSSEKIMKHESKFNTEIHLLGPEGEYEINMGFLALNNNNVEIHAELTYEDVFNKKINDKSIVSLSSLYGY